MTAAAPTPPRPKASNEEGDAVRAINCFTPGTLITTRGGMCPVEELRPGDRLLTRDRGFQPLLWRGMRREATIRPDRAAWPVRIRANALGPGQPARDMVVSPGHRMLCTGPEAIRATGEPEILVEARALAGRPGIERIGDAGRIYVHLLMDAHEVILAENAWTESFRLSYPAFQALTASGRRHFSRLLPAFLAQPNEAALAPARTCPESVGDGGPNRRRQGAGLPCLPAT